jgi:uncharacterized membrane protein
MILIITVQGIMTFSVTILSIMTFIITILSMMTFSLIINKYDTQHNNRALLCCVSLMLSIIYKPFMPRVRYAECNHAECRGS